MAASTKAYKQLVFRNSFTQTAPTLYDIEQVKAECYFPGIDYAHAGTMEKWRCNYSTW